MAKAYLEPAGIEKLEEAAEGIDVLTHHAAQEAMASDGVSVTTGGVLGTRKPQLAV